MPKFFRELMTCISSLNIEKEYKKIIKNEKLSTNFMPNLSCEFKYRDLLKYFAFSKLKSELEQLKNDFFDKVRDDVALRIRNNQPRFTEINKCDCILFVTMKFQCKHIFALRKIIDMPLFEQALYHQRWHKDNTTHKYSKNYFLDVNLRQNTGTTINLARDLSLSQNQKFVKTNKLLCNIAQIMSEKSQNIYDVYYENLIRFKNFIENDTMLQPSQLMPVI